MPPKTLPRVIGPWMAAAIVVGTVIGSGVFKKGRNVAEVCPEFGLAISVWVLGGVLALLGALTIAEVAVRLPKAGGNYAFLSDAALDSMILRARATTDETEKAGLSREIDARVFELAPWIFLWFPVDIWASQPDVKGWRIPLVFTGQRWMEAERTR